jgi:uncharacterized tellurite resistance protein B-like protein
LSFRPFAAVTLMSTANPTGGGMLRSISEFINEITGGDRHPEKFQEDDYHLAAAALLVHVVTSDNNFNAAEQARLCDVIAYRFELGRDDADKLIEAAIRADREAVDLYQFTSVINRALDEEGRRRVVEMMFEVAYADGKLSEFEDNVVWRAAEIMNVPSRERVTIRRHMRDEIADKEN